MIGSTIRPMLLSRLAQTSVALSATRSRLAKRDLIAAVLRETAPDEVETVVSYLAGSLRQRRTGVGWKSLSVMPPPAATPSLTVAEVDRAFSRIAALGGVGSAAARSAAVAELFARATAEEQPFLRGLAFGDLRQGALEAQVQEGLATAFGVPVASVRRAAMLLSSTVAAARVLVGGGAGALLAVGLQPGVAVQPMLASAAADPAAAVAKSGLPAVVDHKLDGIRVQVHRLDDRVWIFTRSLDDITDRLPEVAAVVHGLPFRRLVLDGEVLALAESGRPEAFQVVASQTMRSADVPSAARTRPLQVFFFDLLHVDGRDLLDVTLRERLAVMRELLPAELTVPRQLCDNVDTVAEVFADAVGRGYEGVVVKNLDAPYAAGRRDSAWVKLKPRHTFDLVVTAAEWGHGRRQGWLSNLHLAARDPEAQSLVMLGKTFKGLTDETLAWQTEQLLAREVRRARGTVHVRPELVVEIACDGLQTSSRYPGGVTLRFARVLRYRPDKTTGDADTLASVKALGIVAGPETGLG